MASNIKFKRSSVQNRVPTTAQLELGELALNTYDGKLYTEINTGSAAVVEIGSKLSSLVVDGDNGGGNGDVTFHGATAGRDLFWDASADSLIALDNTKISLGTSSDLSLYHDATHNYLKSTNGRIYLQAVGRVQLQTGDGSSWKNNLVGYQNDRTDIYHNNSVRITTTVDGADISGTGSLKLPVGTTAQRNGSPTAGDMRYNSTTGSFEGYTNGWGELGGAGIGIGSTSVNPGSGVVGNIVGVGYTTINFVGAGLSVTGYGSTVVVDIGNAVSRKYGRKIHSYTATNNQTTFTGLSYTDGTSQVSVYLNGAKLSAATYTATSGNTVVLGTGASVDDEVEILVLDSGVDITRTVHSFTATAGQTAFTGLGYERGENLDVYLNGIRLAQSDYTATNGTSITLATGASVGDLLEVVDMGPGAQWESGFGEDNDDIFRFNGGVGIGTTNPTDKLNIVGNAEVLGIVTARDGVHITGDNKYLKVGAGGDIQIVHTGAESVIANATGHLTRRSDVHKWENYAGSAEYARFTSTGLGIGINAPARNLHVKSSTPYIRLESGAANQPATLELWHTRANGSNKWRSDIATVDGGLTFKTGTAQDGAPAEVLRITSGGQVGIGTDTMDSAGNLNITDTSSSRIYMKSGNSSDCSIYFGSFDDAVTGGIRYDHSDDSLRFYGHNNTQRVVIASDGKLGVGYNFVPSTYMFEVRAPDTTAYSATGTNAAISLGNNNSSAATNSTGISMFTDGNGRGVVNLNALNNSTNASADFTIQTRHSGTLGERFRITSSGATQFIADAYGRLEVTPTTGNGGTAVIKQTTTSPRNGGDLAIQVDSSIQGGNLLFRTGGNNERLRITSAGKLDITNPSSGNVINLGSSTVYANAAINIYRLGNGYADMRLSSNYGAKIALAGASNNTDEFYIQQDNGKNAYIWNEANKGITFGTNATGRMWLDSSGNFKVVGISTFNNNVELISSDAGSSAAPELKFYRNSASPADADYLGQIKFAGESDTGVERNYAKITGKILDASNGTEDGIIEFAHIKAGSQVITGRWRSDSLQLLNGTNMSIAGNLTVTGDLQVDGTNTIVNSTTMTVDDKNIVLGSGAANDAAADGGGITLESGNGNKTFNWVDSTDAWTSSEHIHLGDSKKLLLGASSDLQIFHNSSGNLSTIYNSHANGVAVRSNVIMLQNSAGDHDYLTTANEAGVTLYYDNAPRFATTSDGATLTGRLNPAANNSYGLGTSSLRWANFYSVVGNFSGTVTAAGAALSSGTHEKITLSGSTDPLIRFQEGTTNKAFISWHSGGYIRLQNQEDASILKIQDDIVFSMDDGSTYHKVWHAGNDGSGTGLDADTLDGLQASSFVRSDSSGQSISGNLTVGTGAASYLYMVDSDQGNRALHCNGDRIGFLKQDGNWSAYSKDNGGWVCELGLTVNGGNSSTIVMGDADEGSRQIHCNSNFIGFLKADGNWGSRCADDGSWQILGNTAFHGGNDGAGSGLDADLLDGVQGASYLRSDAADTASADITFGGGAGAISIAANSDIRFSNGTWSGEHAGKLQFHSNIFYIQGGSGGWQFRNPSAAGVISLSASGGIGGSALTVAQKVTFNGSDGAIAIGANSDIRFSNGNWTGDTAGKIQHHSNYLYVQGGSSGIIQRASDGTNIMLANNSNIYSYQTHTFQDGGGAITIAGNSDIRLVNGTWTGDYGAKIQHHDNRLFLQGGSSGVRLRNAAGSRQLKMDNSGNFGPDGSQDYNLGESGQRWNQVWAKTGIFTDDIGATIPSQFPGSNVQLMAYKSTNGQPITNTDCARVLIATDAKQTGAQGYHGSLDFGSSDCTAAVANNEFNWRVASVMSRGAGDTSSTIADGNLEFYTKTASGTVQKQMEIDPSGRVQKFYQPAFLVEHPNNASNSPKQRSDLYMSYLRGFSHVRFNVGSHFNNSTGLFTAPLPGIYCFNVTMTMDGGDGAGHDSDDSAGCYWRIQSNTGTGFYNRTGGNREWHSVNPQYFTESGRELTACFSTIEKLNTNATIGWYFSDWDDTDTRILTATLSGYLMG